MKINGNLAEKFELNIKEEPDNAFKDDSLLNSSGFGSGYKPPKGKFSSKSLSGITKRLKKRTSFEIKKKSKPY
jgi:hypothetical protein